MSHTSRRPFVRNSNSLTSVISFWLGTSAPSGSPPFAWSMGNGGKGRIRISPPFSLDDGWYKEQPCTIFRSFQHRKERKGFKHEFIVLKLLDGSVCRIERMGDPDAPFDAPSPRRSIAHDMAQCFRPDESHRACTDSSDVIAEVELPLDFELMDVLKICRAIQEVEKKRSYPPQIFDCSFFSIDIQVCLTRLVAYWEDQEVIEQWLGRAHNQIRAYLDTPQPCLDRSPPGNWSVLFRVYRVLFPDHFNANRDISLMNEIHLELDPQLCAPSGAIQQEIAYYLNSLLWHSDIVSGLSQFLEEKTREVAVSVVTKRMSLVPNDGSGSVEASVLAMENLKRDLVLLLTSLLVTTGTSANPNSSPEVLSFRAKDFENTTGDRSTVRTTSELNPNARLVVQTRGSTADWYQWMAYYLLYVIYLLLHAALEIWGIWGIKLLVPWTSPSFVTQIDEKLERMANQMEHLTTIDYSDLKRFANELRVLSRHRTTTWGESLWPDCVAKYVSIDTFQEIEAIKPMLEFYPKGQPRFVALSVSAFQTHVLGHIEAHSREVSSVWIGPAKKIRVELLDTLSHIWKSIRTQSTRAIKERDSGILSKGWMHEVDDRGDL